MENSSSVESATTCSESVGGASASAVQSCGVVDDDGGSNHGAATAVAADCMRPPNNGSCVFYPNCLHRHSTCGADGYPLSYGLRYCTAFTESEHLFSAGGQRWLRGVRWCLQDRAAAAVFRREHEGTATRDGVDAVDRGGVPAPTHMLQLECPRTRELAYTTHAACYTDDAHSVCPAAGLLTLADYGQLFAIVWR